MPYFRSKMPFIDRAGLQGGTSRRVAWNRPRPGPRPRGTSGLARNPQNDTSLKIPNWSPGAAVKLTGQVLWSKHRSRSDWMNIGPLRYNAAVNWPGRYVSSQQASLWQVTNNDIILVRKSVGSPVWVP